MLRKLSMAAAMILVLLPVASLSHVAQADAPNASAAPGSGALLGAVHTVFQALLVTALCTGLAYALEVPRLRRGRHAG